MKTRHLTHEQAYIKAVCRAQREAIGFQPAITQRNRKKYDRSSAKRQERELVEMYL